MKINKEIEVQPEAKAEVGDIIELHGNFYILMRQRPVGESLFCLWNIDGSGYWTGSLNWENILTNIEKNEGKVYDGKKSTINLVRKVGV